MEQQASNDTSTQHRTHRTLVSVAVGLSALVGLVAGAAGGFMGSRLLPTIPFLGNEPIELTQEEVDREIVELVEEESATINVVERVTPAVVSIIVRKPLGAVRGSEFGFDEFFSSSSFSEEDAQQLVEIGGGTGFIVTADGLLVTNRHVVEDEAATYSAVMNDGKEFPVAIADQDPFFDIAVLQLQGAEGNLPTVNLGDSGRIRIGQTVIAIGNTLSQYRNTVTKGVVSGIDRDVSAYDFAFGEEFIEGAIQTDAAINPGNSGGPLINLFGEVIGVNTAISAEGEGVGFAIPINEVKQAVADVQEVGRILRPWLGVRFAMIDETLVEERSLTIDHGALIILGPRGEPAVVPNSPASAADLREGDVILSVDGEELTEDRSLADAVRSRRPGDEVTLMVLREEETIQVVVTLAEFSD